MLYTVYEGAMALVLVIYMLLKKGTFHHFPALLMLDGNFPYTSFYLLVQSVVRPKMSGPRRFGVIMFFSSNNHSSFLYVSLG